MDWNAAIEKNREALKRVLAMLVAMAGIDPSTARTEGEPRKTLPRRLHRAVLRLLRPAEAAARRLVIVAARGLSETLKPARSRKPAGKRRPRHPVARGFRLFDPLPRFGRPARRSPSVLPRISFPGFTKPSPIRRPPMPSDPIDAAPLGHRLAGLAATLDDLPRQAKRFAHWQARRDAARTENPGAGATRRVTGGDARSSKARMRRIWPLRPGHPPGRHSPRDRRPAHDIHGVLATVHDLALWAIEPPDTS
ncbi:hypothetical protein [Mesorhizobium sp. CAU 1732]|uniref:hypothetical protein n=1 Tax=Mesorhizobium sp. CAU 1732 TaxID=3140358 RepID=UPI00325FFC34